MTVFRCNKCEQEYEDYYPVDDTCLKCKKGLIRIVETSNERRTNTMQTIEERAYSVGIHKDQTCVLLKMKDLLDVLSDILDINNMDDEEFREAIEKVTRAVQEMEWVPVVQAALMKMSFGGTQVHIARAGGYPCERCPDCYVDSSGSCRNEDLCRAWSIYSNQY